MLTTLSKIVIVSTFTSAFVSGLKITAFDYRVGSVYQGNQNMTFVGGVATLDENAEIFVPNAIYDWMRMMSPSQSQSSPSSGANPSGQPPKPLGATDTLRPPTPTNSPYPPPSNPPYPPPSNPPYPPPSNSPYPPPSNSPYPPPSNSPYPPPSNSPYPPQQSGNPPPPTGTQGGSQSGGSQPTGSPNLDFSQGRYVPINEVPYDLWLYLSMLFTSDPAKSPFNVQCGNEVHYSVPISNNKNNDGPPPVLFFPSSKEYVTDFLSRVLNVSDSSSRLILSKNELALLFFISSEDRVEGKFNNISSIPNIANKLRNGQCVIKTNNALPITLFRGASSASAMQTGSVTNLKVLPPPTCDYKELSALVTKFEDALSNLNSVSDSMDVQRLESKISVMRSTTVWSACSDLLNNAFIQGPVEKSEMSTRCQYQFGTLQYATEVCCNKTLAFTKCCAPRTISYTVDSLLGVKNDFIALQCNVNEDNVVDLLATLNSYIEAVALINDPVKGCAAATFRDLGTTSRDYSSVWQAYSAFFNDCQNEIFGGGNMGKVCSGDLDCYTSCVVPANSQDGKGNCAIPYYSSGDYMTKCFIDKMKPKLKSSLMRIWGINNVTNYAAFGEQFSKKASISQCAGPNGYRYNGGWYQSTTGAAAPRPYGFDSNNMPLFNVSVYAGLSNGLYTYCYYYGSPSEREAMGCFYLPPNKEACESEVQCNWYRWDLYGSPCDTDVLGNGGYMCGDCFGGNNCLDRSMKGGCTIPLNNVNLNGLVKNTPEWTAAENACTSRDGTLWQMPGQFSQVNCFSNKKESRTQCMGNCTSSSGPNPGLYKTCISETLDSAACSDVINQKGIYTYFTWFNNKNVCQSWTDENACNQTLGTLGFKWVPYAQNADQIKMELENNCRQNWCYNKVLTREECFAAGIGNPVNPTWTYWEPRLNGNRGACAANAYGIDAEASCLALGSSWKFYESRGWLEPRVDSQSLCQTGICTIPGQDMLSKEECTAIEFCDRYCPTCTKNYYSSNDAVCYHTNQTRCNLDSSSAVWTSVTPMQGIVDSSNVCIYNSDSIGTCKSIPGSRTLRCEDFSTEKCYNHPFTSRLSCFTNYQPCKTPETCRANGFCNDYELNFYPPTDGACLLPANFQYGYPNCFGVYPTSYGQVYSTSMGCFFPELKTQDCTAIDGGRYVKRATQESECGVIQGCCEKGNCYYSWQLTPKNAQECTKCGGKMQPYHTWQGGSWRRGSMRPLTWMKRSMVTLNIWSQVVDYGRMSNYINQAIGNIVADVIRTEQQCKISPLLTYMKSFACACGTNTDDTCAFQSRKATPVASGSLSCGESIEQSAAGASWKIPEDGVLECNSMSSYAVEKYEPRPSKGNSSDGSTAKRSRIFLQSRSTIDSACYALVQNSNLAFVGQVLGDCVSFAPTVAVKNVEICVGLKTSIPRDSAAYPVNGIALKSVNGANEDVYTASSTIVPYESQSQFCFTVNAGGIFCPVGLKTGWSSIASGAKPTCQAAADTLTAINTAATQLSAGASKLVITVQPGAIQAGSFFSPAVKVEFRDTNNALVATAAGSVTFAVVSGTGATGATVVGTVRVAAVGGVATFDKLSVDKIGTGYKIVAQSGALELASSSEFTVTAGAAAGLAFAQQPGGCVENQAWLQSPTVNVVDSYGNIVSSSSVSITLSLAKTTGESVAVVGTLAKAASSGTAQFTGLKVVTSVNSVVLTAAASGLSSATSVTFNVVLASGYPVSLRFMFQPTGASVASIFLVQPVVQVIDFNGNAATIFDSNPVITLSIADNTGVAGAQLSGTKSATSTGGYAQFSDLTINRAGLAYKLTATAPGLVGIDSTAFNVNGPFALAFSSQPPTEVKTTETFTAEVKVLDVQNNVMLASSDTVLLSIKKLTGTTGATLQGIKNVVASSGTAKFTGLAILKAGVGYQLTASANSGNLIANSESFSVAEPPAGSETKDDDNNTGVIDRISGATGLNPMVIGGIVAAVILAGSVGALLHLRNQARKSVSKSKNGGKSKFDE